MHIVSDTYPTLRPGYGNPMINRMVPNGSPEFAAPDQIFKVTKLMAREALEDVLGQGADMERRPRDAHAMDSGAHSRG